MRAAGIVLALIVSSGVADSAKPPLHAAYRIRPLPRNQSLVRVGNPHRGTVGKFANNHVLRGLSMLANFLRRPVFLFGSLQYGMASERKGYRPPDKDSDADVGFIDPLLSDHDAIGFMTYLWDLGLPEYLMVVARVPQFSITTHCRTVDEALQPKHAELAVRSGVPTNLVILPDERGPHPSPVASSTPPR